MSKTNEQLVYGIHAVDALLSNPYRNTTVLYVSEARQDQRIQMILDKAQAHAIRIERLSDKKMALQFPALVHQGVVALASALTEFSEHDLPLLLSNAKQPPLILILDGITDPHNLGACLRTADATGVDFVVIPKDKNATLTPAASKVACGAAESIPMVRVTNLARAIERLKEEGVWIYGAAGEVEESLYDLNATAPIGLVLGAEGDGMRRLTRDSCDGLFHIPMSGTVSSLNVSVAAGVCLYEVVRQRVPNNLIQS